MLRNIEINIKFPVESFVFDPELKMLRMTDIPTDSELQKSSAVINLIQEFTKLYHLQYLLLILGRKVENADQLE